VQTQLNALATAQAQPTALEDAVPFHASLLRGARSVPVLLNRFSTRPSHSGKGEVNAGLLWFCTGHPRGHAQAVSIYFLSRGFRWMNSIWQFFNDEEGQDVVEYGLLIATIAIVVLIGVGVFGSNINHWFQTLANRITTVGT
jgi:pilus assembly protein Flp/PilA